MSGRDTSFYYSFLVLPAEKRRAIVAVWDFCRAADDAVDENPAIFLPGRTNGAESEVARWRAELAACYGQGRPTTDQAPATGTHPSLPAAPGDATPTPTVDSPLRAAHDPLSRSPRDGRAHGTLPHPDPRAQ